MRRRVLGVAVVLGAGFVACKFSPQTVTDDANVPDAGPCEEASRMCIGGDRLRVCEVGQVTATDTTCSWGCLDGGSAHCARLQPAGGGVTIDDADAKTFGTLGDTQLATATFDTDTGQIDGAAPGPGIEFVTRGTVMVWRFRRLTITGAITIQGARAAAFVATDGITIAGAMTAMGCGGSGEQPGPGGFAGGATAGSSAEGSGAGIGASGTAGGGGGGGGNGGSGGPSGHNELGGSAYGDETIPVLAGGGGGGAGDGGGMFGRGGGGGGAVQLVSNVMITFDAPGTVNAGGCGGARGGGNGDEGGGGGAGGTILLEAPTVAIGGTLAVNGGGGGGGGGGASTSGGKGDVSRTPAPGGDADGADGLGGLGAAAAAIDGAMPTRGGAVPGGGGGGIGRIRINTKLGAGSFTLTGLMSPEPTDAPTRASVAIANVQ